MPNQHVSGRSRYLTAVQLIGHFMDDCQERPYQGARMRALKRVLVVVSWLAIIPTSALAQSTLAGTVKDSSGAVLPGVTVEAASPALIEKVRTTISDGTGQY